MKIYLCGGAIRDELMGLVPKDFDYVVVGSSPEEMISLGYSRVGADFPVFLHPETGDEYALARTERKTGAGYLGFEVNADPTVTLTEDLARRDLTINSMAREVGSDVIIDPHGGMEDLKNKVLRHTSPAFAEDPLRVIRLLRFKTRYPDFSIAKDTGELASEIARAGDLNELANERFWAELVKVFAEKKPAVFFEEAAKLHLDIFVSFFSGLFCYDETRHISEFARVTRKLRGHPEISLMHFVALVAPENALTMKTATSRTQKLHKNVQLLRKMTLTPTAAELYSLLKSLKAFSEGDDYRDARDSLMYAAWAGEETVSRHLIDRAKIAAQLVTAADFDLPQGKELGAAIEAKRIEVIQKAIKM